MSQYFPKPYETFGEDINVKIDLCNYAAKTDLRNATRVDVSSFALKSNSASLKTDVDKLHVVKYDVAKKIEHDKIVTKVDNIDITRFVLKTTSDTDKLDLEKKISDADKKIPDTSDLAKKKQI